LERSGEPDRCRYFTTKRKGVVILNPLSIGYISGQAKGKRRNK
jgi:hypothetical protein